jgi:hypothetical protein
MYQTNVYNIVTRIRDYRRGFGLANRFAGYSPVVPTISSYILKITVTITRKLRKTITL